MLVDLGVLIYFIHHVATSIQLPEVIASIARDLSGAIDAEIGNRHAGIGSRPEAGPSSAELLARVSTSQGATVRATDERLPAVRRLRRRSSTSRRSADAVIELLYRPGHFVVEGLPLAHVWPPEAAPTRSRAASSGRT